MKIALFSSTINETNGYGNITNELCTQFFKMGINFTLFLPKSEMNYIKKYDFKIEYKLPPYIFRMRTPKIFEYLSNIDLSSFDLVHSLFDFPYCVMAARLANKYNKNLIIGAQGTYGVLPLTYWPEKYFLNWSYKKAKLIIVPSVFTKKRFKKYLENIIILR